MCIVIDASAFSVVFNANNQRHSQFKPVLRWVRNGKGKIVYGGKKYKDELRKAKQYLKLFEEFRRKGKLIELNEADVDKYEKTLKEIEKSYQFNDAHLVAIVAVSGCRVVCTDEQKVCPYLKRADFYPKGVKIPKIYRNSSHAAMLKDENIAAICRGLPEGKSARGQGRTSSKRGRQ